SSGETRVLSLNRTERSIRGGGSDWKVTWRHGQPEGKSAPWLGFRGVLELDGKAEPKPEEDQTVAETKGRTSRRGRRSGGGANAGGAPAAVSTPMPTPARGARGDRGRSNEG